MLLESVFELVSSEDQAKMEAAKIQADLAQSQQLKQHLSATDAASASATACTNSQDSCEHGASATSQATTTSSQAVNSSLVTDAVATATAASHQPSLSSAGFMPFAKNPAKQKRYEAYLASQKTGTPCEYCFCSKAGFLLCPSVCT